MPIQLLPDVPRNFLQSESCGLQRSDLPSVTPKGEHIQVVLTAESKTYFVNVERSSSFLSELLCHAVSVVLSQRAWWGASVPRSDLG